MASGMAKSPKRHGLVTRPIVREQWSKDREASAIFAAQQSNKLSIGYQQYRQRFGSPGTSGNVVARGIVGGSYVPTRAPRNPGNLGSA